MCWPTATAGTPDVILMATGSEVALALEARDELASEGIGARVVSMPCWELFDRQPREYRDHVLPPSVRARVAIEQASTLGWDRYVGDGGAVVGMHTFGASAPLKQLLANFGFTPGRGRRGGPGAGGGVGPPASKVIVLLGAMTCEGAGQPAHRVTSTRSVRSRLRVAPPHHRSRAEYLRSKKGVHCQCRRLHRLRRANRPVRPVESSMPLRQRPACAALAEHHTNIESVHLRDLFAEDPTRGERLGAEAAGLYLDYSKNRITDETIRAAARAGARVRSRRAAGHDVRRRAHQRVRGPLGAARRAADAEGTSLVVDGVDVVAEVHEVLDRMAAFADRVRSGEWRGHTGKPIRNVVNIGIGGSDLGPVMAYEALRHYSRRDLTFRFVSNVDSTDLVEATRDLVGRRDALHHLLEDLRHPGDAHQRHLGARLGARPSSATKSAVAKHFVAVSTNAERVAEFGIDTGQHVRLLGLGRRALLDGLGHRPLDDAGDRARAVRRDARRVPRHGRALPHGAARPRTCPVLMGLLAVWYVDFFGAQTIGVMPYDQYLKRFPAYLQQLTMESNGKHVTLDGTARRLRHRRGLLGRAGHERPAQLLPADPPGHPAHPGRPDRLRQEPQPARRPPRHPVLERLRPGPGARLRQDRGGGPGRGHPRGRRAAPGHGGQPTDERPAGRGAHPPPPRLTRRPLRAQRVHPGDRSGASTPSTSGASSWARCWRSRSSPSSRATPSRQLDHDSSTNALIRRTAHSKARAEEAEMATDKPMQLGMIGLGRMGANLVRRLMRDGHRCVVYDVNADAVKQLEAEGATGSTLARGLRRQAREAARGLAHAAGGDRASRLSTSSARCSTPATSSSTAATPTTATTSPAPSSSPPTGSTTSTAARAAASGASSAATA